MRRLARKPMRKDDRAAVVTRAGGKCERCRARITADTGHLHHRKLRVRGGDDNPQNCVFLCAPCHTWAHEHPAEATATGWMVASWDDPATITPTPLQGANQ